VGKFEKERKVSNGAKRSERLAWQVEVFMLNKKIAAFDPRRHETLKWVNLKNGIPAPQVWVEKMISSLRYLQGARPMAFYEFVNNCRNSNSAFILIKPQELELLGLIKVNKLNRAKFEIPKAVMAVTKAAVKGDGFSMKIESPIMPRIPRIPNPQQISNSKVRIITVLLSVLYLIQSDSCRILTRFLNW
jgi:hypothetical protein